MSYFIYILKCSDGSFYTGYTTNIEKRVNAHNNSKIGAKYTKARRPVTLIHSEKFKTLSEALKRESEIKSWNREKKQKFLKSVLL